MKRWQIADGVLEVFDGSKSVIPSTDDIYGAAIEGEAYAAGPSIGEAKTTLGLAFSPYPASVRIVLYEAQGAPIVALQIETQSGQRSTTGIKALEAGHVVVGSSWYPLAPDEAAELRSLVKELPIDPSLRIANFRTLLKLKQLATSGQLVLDQTSGNALTLLPLIPSKEGSPREIQAKLYPYQIEGWNWLRFLVEQDVGALLADEMGLGKTLQVISTILDPGDKRPLRPVLIVAPGSLLENWRREFEKFAPSLSVLKHQGRLRTGRPADLEPFDVVITSYDTVIRDESLLMMVRWRLIVADEAQNIKNPEAIRSQSIKRLPRDVALAMTGTPIENRLEDLWSVMDFAHPGYLGTQNEFSSSYSDDVHAAKRLEPLVSPLMLRRRVASVAKDLPARIDIPQVLELTEEEADEYERIRLEIKQTHGRSATIVALTALRQYCAHPALLTDTPQSLGRTEFTKINRLREILEEVFARREKAIVFTSYTDMADIIATMVKSGFGIFAECLDGRLDIEKRHPLLDRFAGIDGPAALVLNPRAGGSGLNITAANHVIHYNLEWNPALEDQASARVHRRGQTLPVFVHRLFFAGTVEEVVDERIRRKRILSDAAVVGVEGKDEDYEDIVAALERSPARKKSAR